MEDNRRDHLIGDVREGLQEYYPELLDTDYGWELQIYLATVYQDTGNNQNDYEFLRDKAESWLNSHKFVPKAESVASWPIDKCMWYLDRICEIDLDTLDYIGVTDEQGWRNEVLSQHKG
jgi:hypothetical protein